MIVTVTPQSQALLAETRAVFVYGTLKKGFMNHGLIKDQRFLGEARTEYSNFVMLDLGSYPGVVKTLGDGHEKIEGELYNLDDQAMEACDRLEGHPDFYCRELTPVELVESGATVFAWIYIYQGDLGGKRTMPQLGVCSKWEKDHGS